MNSGRTIPTANVDTTTLTKNVPAPVKKIDLISYIVMVHFSKTSSETISDKTKHMLKNEIQHKTFNN